MFALRHLAFLSAVVAGFSCRHTDSAPASPAQAPAEEPGPQLDPNFPPEDTTVQTQPGAPLGPVAGVSNAIGSGGSGAVGGTVGGGGSGAVGGGGNAGGGGVTGGAR